MMDIQEQVILPECNRCGECCKRFTIPISHMRYAENKAAALRGDDTFEVVEDGETKRYPVEAWLCAWDLTPLNHEKAIQGLLFEDAGPENFRYWYRCNFLLRISKQQYVCGVYKDRPRPCRKFMPAEFGGHLTSRSSVGYSSCVYRTEYDWDAYEERQRVAYEERQREIYEICKRDLPVDRDETLSSFASSVTVTVDVPPTVQRMIGMRMKS